MRTRHKRRWTFVLFSEKIGCYKKSVTGLGKKEDSIRGAFILLNLTYGGN